VAAHHEPLYIACSMGHTGNREDEAHPPETEETVGRRDFLPKAAVVGTGPLDLDRLATAGLAATAGGAALNRWSADSKSET
jgi:hypothetical protein